MKLTKKQPIGVFDSGLGGISVLKELHKLMPNEDFIFFGDSKNAPYGTKTVEEVQNLSQQIVTKFLQQNVKAVVIACNTATSAAAKKLRLTYPELPIIGLEPAVKPATLLKPHAKILVMATELTLREVKFNDLIQQFANQAIIYKLPASKLVEFIEKGDTSSVELHAYLLDLLTPYCQKVDAVVLGCTHFPFARRVIQEIMGPDTAIIDGGNGAARELKRVLQVKDLLQDHTHAGSVCFENSLQTQTEIQLSRKLFENNF